MTNCCPDGYIDLSCVGMCDDIPTGLTATSTGLYKLSLVPGGGFVEQQFTIGNPITFANVLNENGVTIFTVQNPDGITMELSGKSCFKVQVKTSLNLV